MLDLSQKGKSRKGNAMRFIVSTAVIYLALTLAAVAGLAWNSDGHTCEAPCSVKFPAGTYEDEVAWNKTENDVLVYKVKPNAW